VCSRRLIRGGGAVGRRIFAVYVQSGICLRGRASSVAIVESLLRCQSRPSECDGAGGRRRSRRCGRSHNVSQFGGRRRRNYGKHVGEQTVCLDKMINSNGSGRL
jgi:hypothetical protein